MPNLQQLQILAGERRILLYIDDVYLYLAGGESLSWIACERGIGHACPPWAGTTEVKEENGEWPRWKTARARSWLAEFWCDDGRGEHVERAKQNQSK